ncbi:MAG: hypothetical protein JXR12_01170 [Neptunomonas phycophila]|uniref:helix-hairpin-helix domain-containing protein n=1 Tax=Neptunomonas phycophila TaxID=1572645 RepID=UPI003B8EA949
MSQTNTIDFGNLEDHSEEELITWLQRQDDLYDNEGESEVDDATYDRVRKMTELMFGANKYFTGVGSDVRGGKVKLPFAMNGLPQCYEGEIEGWLKPTYLQAAQYCVSDKLDGTSALVIYDPNGDLQIAYSRGNGVEAADITRHIKRIHNIPKKIKATGSTFPVRMEIIISLDDWPTVKENFRRSNGEEYKNPRNATAGFMNSSENDDGIYQYLRGVAYTKVDASGTKSEHIDELAELGFETARYEIFNHDEMTDAVLSAYLKQQRASSQYEIDGVVIDVDQGDKRKECVTNGDFISQKYKVADDSNYAIATVKDVPYRASKDGYLKPRINIQPVQLMGVTVSFATGFNAKFIEENGIGPGAKIRITRSGDVIPYVLGTVEKATVSGLPDEDEHGEWEWSENKVDAILKDITNRKDVQVKRLVDIFTKLKIDHLKEGNIEKLFDAGYKSEADIINAEYTDLYMTLGEIGTKIFDSIEERLRSSEGVYWPSLVGSLNLLGRGIGSRKLAELYEAFEGNVDLMLDVGEVVQVPGFDKKTAQKIADNMSKVEDFLKLVDGNLIVREYTEPTAPSGSRMTGKNIVVTGFRDPVFEDKIRDEGGEIKSGVSAKVHYVVAKDPNSASGKVKKARDINAKKPGTIQIMGLKDFEKLLYS